MHTVSGIDVFNNMLFYFMEQITRGGMVPLRTRDGPLTLEVFGCLHQLGTSDYESLFPCLLRNYSRLSVRKTTKVCGFTQVFLTRPVRTWGEGGFRSPGANPRHWLFTPVANTSTHLEAGGQ